MSPRSPSLVLSASGMGEKAIMCFKCTQTFLESLIPTDIKSREGGSKAKHGHYLFSVTLGKMLSRFPLALGMSHPWPLGMPRRPLWIGPVFTQFLSQRPSCCCHLTSSPAHTGLGRGGHVPKESQIYRWLEVTKWPRATGYINRDDRDRLAPPSHPG